MKNLKELRSDLVQRYKNRDLLSFCRSIEGTGSGWVDITQRCIRTQDLKIEELLRQIEEIKRV